MGTLGVDRSDLDRGLVLEIAWPRRNVDCMLAQNPQGDNVKGVLVGRRQHHIRRGSIMMRSKPIGGGHAPPVSGHQTREPKLRHGGAEVVADRHLMRQKLGRDDGANGVTPSVLGSRRAAAISVEPSDRVGSTLLQLST